MMKRHQKIAVWLSFAAVLSLFAVAAFHHHDHDNTAADTHHQGDCTVCRVASSSDSFVSPVPFSIASPGLEASEFVLEITFFVDTKNLDPNISPRAPPLS